MIPLESVNTFGELSICYAANFGARCSNLRLAELGEGRSQKRLLRVIEKMLRL